MKLAAIDIGSNAIRLQISKVYDQDGHITFRRVEFVRYPMQLGKDVFGNGRISKKTEKRLHLLMQSYQALIELYGIDAYRGVATSAMREAANGQEIADQIEQKFGLKIEIIPGSQEAEILKQAIRPYLPESACVHIDVGGGSTELNLFNKRELINSKSFKMGSLRQPEPKEKAEKLAYLKEWAKKFYSLSNGNVTSIGTGGNINKLYKVANKPKGANISRTEMRAVRAYINEFSIEERQNILKMNEDRAEVIVPGAEIYLDVMRTLGSDHMIVPKVGLKDGLMYDLYKQATDRDWADIEFSL